MIIYINTYDVFNIKDFHIITYKYYINNTNIKIIESIFSFYNKYLNLF